jgi:hypothetical protein
MAEFSRTTYNFNNRITLNDDTTDATKFVLVRAEAMHDTLAVNVEEERVEQPGIVDYGVKFSKGEISIPVELYASTEANMAQLIQNFKEAFNPDLLEADSTYGEDTTYNGYHPLDWTETVGATSRDFRIYAKSQETPKVEQDPFAGLFRQSTIKLKVNDPRKYSQATSSVNTDGASATNAGTYPTPVTITIDATGATSINLSIANATTGKTLYVQEALSNGEQLVINTRHHSAKLDGTEDRSKINPGSTWWELNAGGNTMSFGNATNATITVEWRNAWPL